MAFQPHKQDAEELWADTKARRVASDRLMDLVRDHCTCRVPTAGPTYLRVTRCLRCGRKVG